MTELPDPMLSAEVDLREFAFMPLDVVRLRDSDLAAITTGDEFRAAVILWCASWHQVPAASLPDDDVVLARLAGYGRDVDEWRMVRTGALRGWQKCKDGRLYHPVVAEKARAAWSERIAYRERKALRTDAARRAAGARWHGKEDAHRNAPSMHEACDHDAKRIAAVMPKGRGRRRDKGREEPPSSPPVAGGTRADDALYPPEFEALWKGYPRKAGKRQALRAWRHACKRADPALIASGLDQALPVLMARGDPEFIPHLATWLNGDRWLDQPFAAQTSEGASLRSSDADRTQWEVRLRGFAARRFWVEAWGPKPGDPGCFVPREMLADCISAP